jgi:hypothetical protein
MNKSRKIFVLESACKGGVISTISSQVWLKDRETDLCEVHCCVIFILYEHQRTCLHKLMQL